MRAGMWVVASRSAVGKREGRAKRTADLQQASAHWNIVWTILRMQISGVEHRLHSECFEESCSLGELIYMYSAPNNDLSHPKNIFFGS